MGRGRRQIEFSREELFETIRIGRLAWESSIEFKKEKRCLGQHLSKLTSFESLEMEEESEEMLKSRVAERRQKGLKK